MNKLLIDCDDDGRFVGLFPRSQAGTKEAASAVASEVKDAAASATDAAASSAQASRRAK